MKKLGLKTKYDAKRKKDDLFYAATKRTRSLLSVNFRKFLETNRVNSKILNDHLGTEAELFFRYLVLKANTEGLDTYRDYGTTVEIDHIVPLCTFADQAKIFGIEETLKLAFNYKNINLSLRKTNRNHTLKPTVVNAIRTRRKSA